MKKILAEFNDIDKKIMKIINLGLIFSFLIGILGLLLLHTYNTYSVTYDFYKGGFILVKTGITFAAQFIGCGFVFDKIIKEKV